MESREHCSHCRGKSIVRRSDDNLSKTCRFDRISEKSKTPSPKKHAPGCLRRLFEEEKQRGEIEIIFFFIKKYFNDIRNYNNQIYYYNLQFFQNSNIKE